MWPHEIARDYHIKANKEIPIYLRKIDKSQCSVESLLFKFDISMLHLLYSIGIIIEMKTYKYAEKITISIRCDCF